MKKTYELLDEQPMFFDDEPSPSYEIQRRLLHPAITEDPEFRACFEAPEVLARAWRRGAIHTRAAA